MACCATYSSQGCDGKLLRQISFQSSEGGNENLFSEELEFLKNIYLDELTCEPGSRDCDGCVLQFHVTPCTGNDKERQYVYLTVNMAIAEKYPLVLPEASFGQSRGLSDAHLRSMLEGIRRKSVELIGTQMIYELVEYVKECLTDNNTPTEECAICLCNFQDSDEFKKTDCYHYFHLPCLAGYLEFYKKQVKEAKEEDSRMDLMLRSKAKPLECPVCRVPMTMDAMPLDLAHAWSTPTNDRDMFRPTSELRAWQEEMKRLLWRQRQRGGVIDHDDVIDENWVSMAGVEKVRAGLSNDPSSTETLNKPAIVIISKTGAKKDLSMSEYSTSQRENTTQIGKGYSVRDYPHKGYRRTKNSSRYQERKDTGVRGTERPKVTNGESNSQRNRGYNPRRREHQDGARSPKQSRPPKQNDRMGQKSKISGDLDQEQIPSGSQSAEVVQKKLGVTEIYHKPRLQPSIPATQVMCSKEEGSCVATSSEQTPSVTVATKSSKPQSRYYYGGYHSNKRPQRHRDKDFSRHREFQTDRQSSNPQSKPDFTRSRGGVQTSNPRNRDL